MNKASAAFEPEVRNRTCRTMCANFGFAALGVDRTEAHPPKNSGKTPPLLFDRIAS